MASTQTPRFVWESGIWGPIPRWLSPPDITVIETISRSHLQLPADWKLSATFFSEGAFNKLYTITVSCGDSDLGSQYIFRATSPVEPFYKTASEVATLSYIREYTSIPVPRIIAYCSTAENDLGCEWVLMERLPGVALAEIWSVMDLETKSRETKSIAGYIRQLRDAQRRFTAIGNLYFREDINTSNPAVHVVSIDNTRYVLGPIVTTYMFAGGRKLRVPRNLGPYSDDSQYITALTASELEDMRLLLSVDARSHEDFDEDLAEDAEDIIEALNKLETISTVLFPSRNRYFALYHHDLSLANIIVDPATFKVTGIVDWECVGTRPHWQDTYPLFLYGPDITEDVEPLAPGDTDEYRMELWENWEKTKLRPVFDQELGEACYMDDGEDEARREFRQKLDLVEVSPGKVNSWVEKLAERRPSLAGCSA